MAISLVLERSPRKIQVAHSYLVKDNDLNVIGLTMIIEFLNSVDAILGRRRFDITPQRMARWTEGGTLYNDCKLLWPNVEAILQAIISELGEQAIFKIWERDVT